jgi:uncharacterized protein
VDPRYRAGAPAAGIDGAVGDARLGADRPVGFFATSDVGQDDAVAIRRTSIRRGAPMASGRKVAVGSSPRAGRGVFATAPVAAGEVLEVCPVVVVPADEVEVFDDGALYGYCFWWPRGRRALAFGYGSLYNHAQEPNAEFNLRVAAGEIEFKATRDIEAGDEVTVSYGDDLWFDPR